MDNGRSRMEKDVIIFFCSSRPLKLLYESQFIVFSGYLANICFFFHFISIIIKADEESVCGPNQLCPFLRHGRVSEERVAREAIAAYDESVGVVSYSWWEIR